MKGEEEYILDINPLNQLVVVCAKHCDCVLCSGRVSAESEGLKRWKNSRLAALEHQSD
jgi:ferredoxin